MIFSGHWNSLLYMPWPIFLMSNDQFSSIFNLKNAKWKVISLPAFTFQHGEYRKDSHRLFVKSKKIPVKILQRIIRHEIIEADTSPLGKETYRFIRTMNRLIHLELQRPNYKSYYRILRTQQTWFIQVHYHEFIKSYFLEDLKKL